jgi:hypothetical protein
MATPQPTTTKRTGLHWRDLLLAIPFLALLFPALYSRRDPMLWGFPFFYWYQFAWVPLGAAITAIVFVLHRRDRR